MTNLTVKVDDEVLKRARIRALEEGTSVNAVLRAFLAEYTGSSEQRRAAGDEFLSLAEEYEASSGPGGRSWSRDDLYERG
jgi:plasmid stability protein